MESKDDFSDYSEGDGDDNEDEVGERRKAGPWNKGDGPKEPQPQQPKPEPQPEKSNVYVSPMMRQQSLKPIILRKGAAPDLANEEFFPTLGSVRPEELKKKKNEPAFEEVKQGARYQRSSDLQANAPVAVGNRYAALNS